MGKFAPGSPCPYHRSYTKSITARYRDQMLAAGAAAGGGVPAQVQPQARKMEPIWDIVSGLAKALSEARDQIATLMKQQQNGEGSFSNSDRTSSPSYRAHSANRYAHNRCPPTPRDRSPQPNRNIHRSHAHGYCAFGRNTASKELMHHNAGGVRYSSPKYTDMFQPSGINSSKGSGPGREDEQKGRGGAAYGIKLRGDAGNCGINVVPGSKSYTCRQVKGKKGIHLSAQMRDCHLKLDSEGNKFDAENPVKIRITAPTKVRPPPTSRKPSPDVKRYCVGTQYANLLKEEAYHLREQRTALEPKARKAHWHN
ncbi:hypothetical protein R1sor_017252 [Riccia sorocarpa]|uniref:Uncharacterized protein n=1 Tax=Riccia sorocarpa TaxID=122646 RepID=A0ABD3IA14_9MARC